MRRRDWYRELDPAEGEHPIDQEAQRWLSDSPEYQELRARVLEVGGMLGTLLDGAAKELWLAVEADINHRWALVAETYFNLGVEHGLAERVVDDVLGDAGADPKLRPAAAMRALAKAMAGVADRLG